ncbi:hypothetical protein BZL30_1371 [Mycobacterium kansasii]|uniref:Uncharacterized protein n=1 Tax=Mycobacterium kansasii TaxID=1768 RepID=A0A1V3XTJ1_MYCKA|nr:hypothetical protein BZL30_1371 [Mycobacterium kansasii]
MQVWLTGTPAQSAQMVAFGPGGWTRRRRVWQVAQVPRRRSAAV